MRALITAFAVAATVAAGSAQAAPPPRYPAAVERVWTTTCLLHDDRATCTCWLRALERFVPYPEFRRDVETIHAKRKLARGPRARLRRAYDACVSARGPVA